VKQPKNDKTIIFLFFILMQKCTIFALKEPRARVKISMKSMIFCQVSSEIFYAMHEIEFCGVETPIFCIKSRAKKE